MAIAFCASIGSPSVQKLMPGEVSGMSVPQGVVDLVVSWLVQGPGYCFEFIFPVILSRRKLFSGSPGLILATVGTVFAGMLTKLPNTWPTSWSVSGCLNVYFHLA